MEIDGDLGKSPLLPETSGPKGERMKKNNEYLMNPLARQVREYRKLTSKKSRRDLIIIARDV